MQPLQQIRQWYYSLPQKEQRMIGGTTAFILLTLFYLVIWEPLQLGLAEEKQKQQTQQEILLWMQQAATEVKTLRAAGSSSAIRDKNKATTLVIEQSVKNAGLKSALSKIESSGNNGARVNLHEASFNQMLVWLNTLAKHYGITVASANIERAEKPGRVNARLIFERP